MQPRARVSTHTRQASGVKVVILDFSPDAEADYKKAYLNQLYLNQTNYQSETAMEEYISQRNNMFNSIRSQADEFSTKLLNCIN